LNYPAGFILDKKNDSLIICDYENSRVVRWFRQNNTDAQIIISNIECIGVTINNNGDIYVSDAEKSVG
jgi:hypothetical protein